MNDILDQIGHAKRAHISASRARVPLAELETRARTQTKPRGFISALRNAVDQYGTGLIAEIKKASPSGGLIRKKFEPSILAQAYSRGGAACLSVLTDTPYFQGRDSDLEAARQATQLPVLRKDFMIDPYQIVESRAIGADCILLILAMLSDAQAEELEAAALDYDLDILVEVHNSTELKRALRLNSPLIGINNRNLKTLEVNLETSVTLAKDVPADRLLVGESGIRSRADLDRLREGGIRCFLIGEYLMRETDVEEATRQLLA